MSSAIRAFRLALAFVLIGLAGSNASAQVLSFQQIAFIRSGGDVIATLTGTACAEGVISPVGVIAAPSSGDHFFVYSGFSAGCPGSFAVVPFSSTVDLGPLGDGNYIVTWGLATGLGIVGPQFTAAVVIRNGVLQTFFDGPNIAEPAPAIIPTLSVVGFALLSLVVLFASAFLARLKNGGYVRRCAEEFT